MTVGYQKSILAALDVPILMSVHGDGVFEGAEAVRIDESTAIAATGLRTNDAGWAV